MKTLNHYTLFIIICTLPYLNYAQWDTTQVLDSQGNVGLYVSMQIVDGYPAVAYYHNQDRELRYMRATDPDGRNWGSPVVVAVGGRYASMAVVNNKPAIAYFSKTGENLMFVRASNPQGTSWGTPMTLDAPGSVGHYISLDTITGAPAISYFDATNFNLKYIRAIDAAGTNWNSPVTVVSSSGWVGQYTSLEEVNNNPAISYYNREEERFEYIRATDGVGNNWGSPVVVDDSIPSSFHSHTSLAVVNGNPAIAYHDDDNQDLKYVRATNENGTSWGTPVRVDSINNTGDGPSLAVVNGKPAIAYNKGSGSRPYYVQALNNTGSAWGTPEKFFDVTSTSWYYSLLEVNGKAAIAYYVLGSGDLNYIQNESSSLNKTNISLKELQSGFSLYPNPAGDELIIQLGSSSPKDNLYIIDLRGKVIYSAKLKNLEQH